VLILDEVAVTDIADALMLRKLFRRLFHNGMVLVATSNRAPDDLYLGGLQRPSFLPFIDDVKERCDVHELQSTVDYRTLAAEASPLAELPPDGAGTFLHPLDEATGSSARRLWEALVAGSATAPQTLRLSGRTLNVPEASEEARAARFSFAELCGTRPGIAPLGPEDYLRVAKAYAVVVLEGVPQLTLHKATELRRLITAVDAFYDAQVLLVVTAAVAPADLFLAEGADSHADKFGDVIGNIVQDSGDEEFAFARTLSRLQEMRTYGYVARCAGGVSPSSVWIAHALGLNKKKKRKKKEGEALV